MNIIQHPRRLNGLRRIESALFRRLEHDLSVAFTSMSAIVTTLSGVVRRTNDERAGQLLKSYEHVFAEFQNILAAPVPVISDLATLGRRFMALSETMETLADAAAGWPAEGSSASRAD